MDLGKTLLQSGAKIEEVLEWQIRVQTADDVKFRDGFRVSGSGGLESLFQRHRVGARSVFLPAERAEPAGGYANIRWIDVPVDVEISYVAMHALANLIRHPAEAENVAGPVKDESIVAIESLACHHLVVNSAKTRVIRLKRVSLAQTRHYLDDIPGSAEKGQSCVVSFRVKALNDMPPSKLVEILSAAYFLGAAQCGGATMGR